MTLTISIVLYGIIEIISQIFAHDFIQNQSFSSNQSISHVDSSGRLSHTLHNLRGTLTVEFTPFQYRECDSKIIFDYNFPQKDVLCIYL